MKEYILAEAGGEILVAAEFFEDGEGRAVTFTCKGGIWEGFRSPNPYEMTGGIRQDGLGSIRQDDLASAGRISLPPFETGAWVSLFDPSVFAWLEPYDMPIFRSYVLSRTILGGRAPENDICFADRKNISRKHFVVCRGEDGWSIRNCSPNGLYVNGKKCSDEQALSYGDCIEVFGFHMFFLDGILLCQKKKGVTIRLPECPQEARPDQSGPLGEADRGLPEKAGQSTTFYHRSPRKSKLTEPEPIVVEKPPDIRIGRRDSWVNVFGPIFTMMIPMISGSLFMIYAAQSTGSEMNLALYAGVVMAMISGVCTIIWSIISRFLSARDRKKELGDLALWYRDYLKRVNDRLSKDYDTYRLSLIEKAPGVDSLSLVDEKSSTLWGKNPFHEDFLSCRVGIGNLPYPWEVKLPSEEFRDYGQELWMEVGEMKNRYRTLYKVPILMDVRRKRMIGFSAALQEDRMDFLRSMTVQIAAAHCYTEVKLVYIFNGNKIRPEDGIESLRWLPHVYDRTRSVRYLASSREETRELLGHLEKIFRDRRQSSQRKKPSASLRQAHYVIFNLEPEYLEDEMFLHYFEEDREMEGKKEENLGLTGIWITRDRESLPNSCDYILEKNEIFQGIWSLDAGGEDLKEVLFDKISGQKLDQFARRITDIRVAELEAASSEIPEKLTFFRIFNISQAKDLNIGERWKRNRAFEGLRAGIGLQAGSRLCILDISEKYHGPHGLVAGTTGSGKSETLQTFLLSLAVNYSPEDVNFFLIDYKGGGMADLFEGIPHLCGQISNLSGGLVKRAMVSIKSENQRRQRLFKKYKVNNINDYQTLFHEGEIGEALAHLIIVIDEFAELKKEEPDFMKELISVAQVGRSLGVHLILATQKPGGTVDDKIWSNSRFRICLRVQDKQDSMEMLHTPDAADITLPGRGYLQVGNNEIYEPFQSGWSGAPADRRLSEKRAAYPVRLNGKPAYKAGPDKEKKKELVSQLEAVREEIARAADRAFLHAGRKLWMEPLPNLLNLDEISGDVSRRCSDELPGPVSAVKADSAGAADSDIGGKAGSDPESEEKGNLAGGKEGNPIGRIGLFDDPVNQKQPAFDLSLSQSGHILVCGVSMSGKSSLLQTFLFSLCRRWGPEDFQFYGIDFGGGTLQAFDDMPQAGMIALEGENEKIRRILEAADRQMTERKKLFRGGNYFLYKRSLDRNHGDPSVSSVPLLLLVIDHYPGLWENLPEKQDQVIQRIAKEGEKAGVLLFISGSGISVSEIPSSLANCFKTKIGLEQKEAFGYTQLFGTLHMPDLPGKGIPGRGIAGFEDRYLEFQAALCIPDRDDYVRMEYIRQQSSLLGERMVGRANRVRIIPERIGPGTICSELAAWESVTHDRKTLMAGYLDEDARACLLSLPSLYCFFVLVEEKAYKQALYEMIQDSCSFGREIDFVVIDPQSADRKEFSLSGQADRGPERQSSQPAGEKNSRAAVRYLSQAVEIIDYFQEMIPLIQKRAGKEPEGLSRAGSDTGNQVLILITDFPAFLDMACREENQMIGFLENIWSKGEGLGITFVAVADYGRLSEARQASGFSTFCSYGTGMQVGGVPADAGVFDLTKLDFRDQMGQLASGEGFLYLPHKKPARIWIPKKGEGEDDTY